MLQALRSRLSAVAFVLLLPAALASQGVQVKDSAGVLYGTTAKCSQPAVVDLAKIRKATPEWKTIKAEGVHKGSARYDLLVEDMNKRIRRICADVAKAAGKDCVIAKGEIENENGLTVTDLTDQVVTKLESEGTCA